MYAEFYGLDESPFALTPDPRYLFMSEPHKEALASAVYGVQERKGFVLILGEVGTGKTTLIRHLLGRFGPNIRSVFVFNPAVSFTELLQLILRDLELPCPSVRRVEMIDTLNEYLLKEAAAGRYVVVIIDEAQHLSPAVLEEVRMLSNLETARGKLIQILLVGQPELGDKLARPELRQLRQRISLVAELKPLSYEDTVRYIHHRLEVAGRTEPLFTKRALKRIYRASGGIPRLVNVLCDKSLVLGYAAGAERIKAKLVKEVLEDWKPFQRAASRAPSARTRAAGHRRARPRWAFRRIAAVLAVGVAGAALIAMLAGRGEGHFLGRLWHGLVPGRASGTVGGTFEHAPSTVQPVAAAEPPAVIAAALPPELGQPSAAPAASRDAAHDGAAPPAGKVPSRAEPSQPAMAPPPGKEIVVAPGEVLSEVIARHYGRADLTLLDLVKAANPGLDSIDLLQVGQRVNLPAIGPAAVVHRADNGRYRVHVMTVWDESAPAVAKLRAAAAGRDRQVHVSPVKLTERDAGQRLLVGDFDSPEDAEAFYREFRIPSEITGQLWR